MYITLQTAKQHLIIDESFKEDDKLILLYIQAVESATAQYLGKPLSELLVDGELPKSLVAAMLLQIGTLYANRESEQPIQLYNNKTFEYLLFCNNDFSENRF